MGVKANPKHNDMDKSTQAATRRAIRSQLLENTGTHFLDSGGANGRAWQRNRGRGVKFGEGPTFDDCGATIPVQDYMVHCFARTREAADLERALRRRLTKIDPDAAPDYYNREAVREVLEAMGCDAGGDHSGWKWWNTYNDETDLSQVLQLVTFRRGDADFALVQVHGGADVRGGYTDGKVYEVPEYYNLFDVRAEVTRPEGDDDVSVYEAEKLGAAWDEQRDVWAWPDGTPVSWNIPACDYYGHPEPKAAAA